MIPAGWDNAFPKRRGLSAALLVKWLDVAPGRLAHRWLVMIKHPLPSVWCRPSCALPSEMIEMAVSKIPTGCPKHPQTPRSNTVSFQDHSKFRIPKHSKKRLTLTVLTSFQFSPCFHRTFPSDPMPRKYRLREERRSAAPEGPALVNMTFPGRRLGGMRSLQLKSYRSYILTYLFTSDLSLQYLIVSYTYNLI